MLLALIRKEIYNLFRNRLLLGMVVMYPIVVLMLLPFATTTDIKNLQTIVIDHDHTSLSQRLQQQFFSSGYFVNAWQGKLPPTLREGMELIEDGKADLIITIPLRFEEQLMRDQKAQIEARINAFNATKGAVAGGYTQQIVQQFVAQLNESTGLEELATIPLRIVEVNRYNPEGNYKNYIIPGLVAMLITITAFVLPALNMVQEKEVGTIEQMNVTPIHPLIFMLSKALPYLVIAVGMALISLPIVGLMYGLYDDGSDYALRPCYEWTGTAHYQLCAYAAASDVFLLLRHDVSRPPRGTLHSDRGNAVVGTCLGCVAPLHALQYLDAYLLPQASSLHRAVA